MDFSAVAELLIFVASMASLLVTGKLKRSPSVDEKPMSEIEQENLKGVLHEFLHVIFALCEFSQHFM